MHEALIKFAPAHIHQSSLPCLIAFHIISKFLIKEISRYKICMAMGSTKLFVFADKHTIDVPCKRQVCNSKKSSKALMVTRPRVLEKRHNICRSTFVQNPRCYYSVLHARLWRIHADSLPASSPAFCWLSSEVAINWGKAACSSGWPRTCAGNTCLW